MSERPVDVAKIRLPIATAAAAAATLLVVAYGYGRSAAAQEALAGEVRQLREEQHSSSDRIETRFGFIEGSLLNLQRRLDRWPDSSASPSPSPWSSPSPPRPDATLGTSAAPTPS